MSRTSRYASSHSVRKALFRLTNDTTCILLGPLNAGLQFHVRCNRIEETCRWFYCKLSFHELFIYARMFFEKLSHHFKIKRAVSFRIYTSGLTKNWNRVLYSLQMTFPVSFTISRYQNFQYVYQLQCLQVSYHLWCCSWPSCKPFIKHVYFHTSFKANFVTFYAYLRIFA